MTHSQNKLAQFSLQTCTYNARTRQISSALTYSLLFRLRRPMGTLSSHPCLPSWQNRQKQQGPFAPSALPRVSGFGTREASDCSFQSYGTSNCRVDCPATPGGISLGDCAA